MERLRAGGRLLVDDDGDRTALDAFSKCDAASTGEPRVRESLQHLPVIISRYNNALISLSNVSFFPIPMCFEQILPSREIITVTGKPTIGP